VPLFEVEAPLPEHIPFADPPAPATAAIVLDRGELLDRRDQGLYGNNLDYVYMAIEIDYPSKLKPQINVGNLADRWSTPKKSLSEADVTIAIGRLCKKGFLDLPSLKLDVTFTVPDPETPAPN
jgi:hypothetical protein